MRTELTCIECPMGCKLTVELENGKVTEIAGNNCPRGKMYAENEVIDPKRVITSTVKLASGGVVPVKTDAPVSKKKMFEVMEIINSITVSKPIKTGDIIKENVFGANIICARTIE